MVSSDNIVKIMVPRLQINHVKKKNKELRERERQRNTNYAERTSKNFCKKTFQLISIKKLQQGKKGMIPT